VTSSQAQRPAARGGMAKPAERATPRGPSEVHPARRAAAQVIEKHTVRVELPAGLGAVQVPTPERMAFYGGIATLAAFGIMEWPIALVISISHLLAEDHHHKMLADFGEALAEA